MYFVRSMAMLRSAHTLRRGVVLCATIFLASLFVFVLPEAFCAPPTSLPSQILTTGGKIYDGVKLVKILPNGLVIQYFPKEGGTGLATLKFNDLPISLQKQFGYNPTNAAVYEKSQAAAMIALSKQLREDETVTTAAQTQWARPKIIWKISEPTVSYSYYDSAGPKPSIFGTNSRAVSLAEPHFICGPDITFRSSRQGTNGLFVLYFDTVTISLDLSTVITLPQNAYNDIIVVEEGRRRLYENLYKLGRAAMQHDVESVVFSEDLGGARTALELEKFRSEVRSRVQEMLRRQCINRIESAALDAGSRYVEMRNREGINFQSDAAVKMLTGEYEPKVTTPLWNP
jgi:hypothetical protein